MLRSVLLGIALCLSSLATAEPGRVTVVMTTYNREPIVMDAVRSILGQTYGDFDFIIVDDASTDRTFERLQREIHDRRVRVYRLSRNVGMYAASNYALTHWVEGEFVTWQDSDDTSHPDCLRQQVEHIDSYPVDAVSIPHLRVNENEVNYNTMPDAQAAIPNHPLLRRWATTDVKDRAQMSVTRSLFRTKRVMELGGFNGRYRMSMDSDFIERFMRLFPTGALRGEPLYFYHPRPDSLTEAPGTHRRSLARRKIHVNLMLKRCASFFLHHIGETSAHRSFQTENFWYPEDLDVADSFVPTRKTVAQ